MSNAQRVSVIWPLYCSTCATNVASGHSLQRPLLGRWTWLYSIWLMCTIYQIIQEWKRWLHHLAVVGFILKFCRFCVTIEVSTTWISWYLLWCVFLLHADIRSSAVIYSCDSHKCALSDIYPRGGTLHTSLLISPDSIIVDCIGLTRETLTAGALTVSIPGVDVRCMARVCHSWKEKPGRLSVIKNFLCWTHVSRSIPSWFNMEKMSRAGNSHFKPVFYTIM